MVARGCEELPKARLMPEPLRTRPSAKPESFDIDRWVIQSPTTFEPHGRAG